MYYWVSADSRHEVQSDILKVDRQPPSTVASSGDKCDRQRGGEGRRSVIDTGATARGQSNASKNRAIDSPAL